MPKGLSLFLSSGSEGTKPAYDIMETRPLQLQDAAKAPKSGQPEQSFQSQSEFVTLLLYKAPTVVLVAGKIQSQLLLPITALPDATFCHSPFAARHSAGSFLPQEPHLAVPFRSESCPLIFIMWAP